MNGTSDSDVPQSQFFPLFDGSYTGRLHHQEGSSSEPNSGVKLKRLLDVGGALVKEYARDIRSRINAMAGDDTEGEGLLIGKEFDERHHWHSLRPLSDDYDRTKQSIKDKLPTDPEERRWYLRQKMMTSRFFSFYGNSLVGGVDQAKPIIVKEEKPAKKTGKNKEGKMGQNAKRIIEKKATKDKDEEKLKDQEK